MSNVRGRGQTPQSGYQTRDQIETSHPQTKPRDDLAGAFAGEKNREGKGTHEKSRKIPRDSDKTPKR